MRSTLYIFSIFALILAQISPACAFMSGKYIQICGADGSIKTISVEEAGDAAQFLLAMQGNDKDPGHEHPETQCSFCFAAKNIKPTIAGVLIIAPARLEASQSMLLKNTGDVALSSQSTSPYFSQGPPSFV